MAVVILSLGPTVVVKSISVDRAMVLGKVEGPVYTFTR